MVKLLIKNKAGFDEKIWHSAMSASVEPGVIEAYKEIGLSVFIEHSSFGNPLFCLIRTEHSYSIQNEGEDEEGEAFLKKAELLLGGLTKSEKCELINQTDPYGFTLFDNIKHYIEKEREMITFFKENDGDSQEDGHKQKIELFYALKKFLIDQLR